MAPTYSRETPRIRCPIMSGTVALCFSASARNWLARSPSDIPVKRCKVRSKNAEENREQQQRVFGRLSQCLRSLDVQARVIQGGPHLRRRKALGVHQRVREGHLKLDLIAA